MALSDQDKLTPNVRRLELQVSDLYDVINGQGGIQDQITTQGLNIQSLIITRTTTPAYPVANLLYDGEIGHSVNSWFNTVATTTYQNKQSAWWWSHNAPATLQTFTAVVTPNVIPLPNHNYTTGCTVQFTNTGGALPTNLVAGTTYYVIYLTPSTISVSATLAGAFAGTVFAIPASGTGTQTIQQVLNETAQWPGDNLDLSLRSYEDSTPSAAGYDPHYCRWDNVNGEAQLTGTMSLDQRLPSNFIDATTTLARISLICARANGFIEIPNNCLIGAGIWDNTVGQNCFLTGAIGFTAEFIGTPTPSGATRQFRALLTSDKGFQTLSPIVSVLNTPTSLDSLHYIQMRWDQQAGQLQVDLYEFTGGVYHFIASVSSATSYIYEGAYEAVVPGWPASTGATRNATFYTSTGDLSGLAVNGVSAQWNTINFPIGIPDNYNKANTTGHEWFRLCMTQALNLFITNVVTDGTTTITLPDGAVNSAAFNAGGYGTGSTATACLYVGLVVQVYDINDVLLVTTSVASVASNNSITLADAVPADMQRKVRIVGGGFHGLLVDKIHLGFQQNTSYAPNANDHRQLQPVAAPTSSTQGTVGGGGDGGGVVSCVAGTTPIKQITGIWREIQHCRPGSHWAAPGIRPNLLTRIRNDMEEVRNILTANGCFLVCTDTERFVTSNTDENGTPLHALRVGDSVLTEIDGRVESSKIVSIGPRLGKVMVYTPTLSHDRLFIGGELRLSIRNRLRNWLRGRSAKVGGYVLHNRKQDDGGDVPPIA